MDSNTRTQSDGDELESEAEGIVETFNEATPSYAQKLEWFGMSHNHDTGDASFVFEAVDYISEDGLQALRENGRTIEYIEAYEFDGDVFAQIHIPVGGEE